MSIVYLNGSYLPKAEAHVSVEDRGFLLGDGVYEVTPAFRGRPFLLDRHMERLTRGLAALRIAYDPAPLADVHRRLLEENGLDDADAATVYVQVTRGAAARSHHFPAGGVTPTVYAFAQPFVRPTRERWAAGYAAVTVPDRRWARVDIKTISLVANVLAQQAAVDAGVDDVILVRDGIAIEGAHSNLFAVCDGVVCTAPANNYILHGITRGFVLELADALSIPVAERPIAVEELADASEVFLTGTTTEVRPLVTVDGKPIGNGRPGPLSERLYEAIRSRTAPAVAQAAASG